MTETRRSQVPFAPLPAIHRAEGGAVAAASVVLFVLAGYAWWWLLALFLVFDVSFVGYVAGNRVGAFCYNLAHNYVGPATLVSAFAVSAALGTPLSGLVIVAAVWFFHVGADRAMGFGPRPAE